MLRQALSAFRKQLGPDVLITHGEEEVGLATRFVTCDATEFEEACGTGSHELACALYRGDFLAGFHATGVAPEFEQWVDAEAGPAPAARARRGLAHVTPRSEDAGNATEALRWARHAVDLEPADEAGVARLIALLDRQGDRARALAVYSALERRLANEFSAQPAPETRALMQALRQRQTPVSVPQPSDGSAHSPPAAPAQTAGLRPIEHVPARETPPRNTRRSRRHLLIAGGMGALATLMLVALLGPSRPAEVTAGKPPVLAVVPFRVHAPDSAMSWLHEGMVELLTMRLAGSEALPVVDPGLALTAWQQGVTGWSG